MKKQKVAAEEQGAQEPKTKRKRKTKVMSKKARETLQDSIRAIDTSVLVSEVVTALKEQCCDGSLTTFTNELCEANELLKDLVDYHRDIFATLHADCKKEKNCQIQFQMKWYSHCSAFLLEEKYPLNIINLEEDSQPGLAKLRQAWLDFCKEHGAPIPASRPAMMSFSTAMYNSLLEHVSSFQSSKNDAMDTGTTSYEVTEEDGVYYRFGGGALCEMLHCRYNQIRSAMNKNLMSIKISILQAINTKDKSDVPGYLKYQDRGYMYFPHKVFIPFLQEVDTNLKKVVDPTTFNEHGDNLIKVRLLLPYLHYCKSTLHCRLHMMK